MDYTTTDSDTTLQLRECIYNKILLGNPTLYGYVNDPNTRIDSWLLGKEINSMKWFNKATPEDVSDNKAAVERQLRNGGENMNYSL